MPRSLSGGQHPNCDLGWSMRELDHAANHARRDGWTAQRQLAFLTALARTRRVTAAARAAGMSRESAYRLRAREPDGLFAAAWAAAFGTGLALKPAEVEQGHIRAVRDACGTEGANLRLKSRRASTS